MTKVRESYQPLLMAVNAANIKVLNIGGFLCKTSGTISIVSASPGAVLYVDAVPVTAGFYTPIPIDAHDITNGFLVTLAGGASGTLMR